MSKIIVITGASSGFGALAARALAVAGHRVRFAWPNGVRLHNLAEVLRVGRRESPPIGTNSRGIPKGRLLGKLTGERRVNRESGLRSQTLSWQCDTIFRMRWRSTCLFDRQPKLRSLW